MERCDVLNVLDISKSTRWAIGTLNIATSITASAGNFVVITVILSKTHLRTRPNSLLCCLALTDLAVGFIMQPIISTQLLSENAGRNCTITYILYCTGTLLCGSSSFILALISYDRYLHLVKLQNYSEYMPKRKVILLLVFCWLIPGLNGSLVLDESTRATMYILTVSALVLCTAALAIWSRKMYSFINNRRQILPIPVARTSKIAEQLHVKRHSKLARMLLIIVGCYIISWAPFTVYTVYATVYKLRGIAVSKSNACSNTIHCIVLTIGLCNSSINPAIYFWRNQSLRAEANRFIRNVLDL